MHVRNHAGQASAPGGFYWENPGDVVEVPDRLGTELVRLNPNDFEEVAPEPEGPAPFSFSPEGDGEIVNESTAEGAAEGVVPDGTAAEVLDWVGSDRERAALALAAEKAKGEAARTSLIPKLEKLAAAE